MLAGFVLVPGIIVATDRPYLSSGAHAKLVDKLSCEVEDPDKQVKMRARKYQYGKSTKGKPLFAYIVDPAKGTQGAENLFSDRGAAR